MKPKKMNFKKMLLAMLLTTPTIINAQVTIGSNIPPASGALLELKSNEDGISEKGLQLPRVFLMALIPASDSALASSLGNTGEFPMTEHTGLIVYNLNRCLKPVSYAGIYIWNGSEWIYIGNEKEIEIDYAPDLITDWGDKVWKHKDQDGNDFYSSVFGSAGRWTTTSIAATSYDSIRTASDSLISNALAGPSANSVAAAYQYIDPVWCYPDGKKSYTENAGKDSTTFSTKPTMGLLYNWAAATNSKGGADGNGNASAEGGSASQARIQGICPAGWHLPSDYEWTELENAIIYKTASYSRTPDIAPTNAQYFDPASSSSSSKYRGTHGIAMTDPCATFSEGHPAEGTYQGTSFKYKVKGFDAFYTGYAENFHIVSFGSDAYFWTSSSDKELAAGVSTAWFRQLSSTNVGVRRVTTRRQYMFSVRCKKDE